MGHRSVPHRFMLQLIPNSLVEQARPPLFSVSGIKHEAGSTLLLSLESSLSHASEKTHQSGQHRPSSGSSSAAIAPESPSGKRILSLVFAAALPEFDDIAAGS